LRQTSRNKNNNRSTLQQSAIDSSVQAQATRQGMLEETEETGEAMKLARNKRRLEKGS